MVDDLIGDQKQALNHLLLFFSVAKTDSDNIICIDIRETFEYLIGLWVAGHATWAQAFKIENKSKDFDELKIKKKTQNVIDEFQNIKDTVTPKHCNCYQKGVYYPDFDHLINPNKTKFKIVKSEAGCQAYCYEDENCVAFTFYRNVTKCFMHESDENELNVDNEHDENDIISGPKICPQYYSFCCNLGYGISVFITVLFPLIVLIGIVIRVYFFYKTHKFCYEF